MRDADYIVIVDPECDALNGRWYDLAMFADPALPPDSSPDALVYTPTPFVQVRDDGAVAQVYMRSEGATSTGETDD